MVERETLEGILVMGLLIFMLELWIFIILCYLFLEIMGGMIISYVLDMLFVGLFFDDIIYFLDHSSHD